MQDQFESTGQFSTPNAQKYLIQLCKHFGHKVPAEVTGDKGQVTFGKGHAAMSAHPDRLVVVLTAAVAEALPELQHVIDDHLQRFAFRENFSAMEWSAEAASQPAD